MGLDITAYRKLTPAPDAEVDSDGYPVDWKNHTLISAAVIEGTEEHWPGRTAPIAGGIYTASEVHDFRAGAYSSYNRWRDWLSRAAGHGSPQNVWNAKKPSGPFVELINFSDCEGIIGPEVAAKLAKDFAEHEGRIIGADNQGHDASMYRHWRKAFEMAADGGCVVFH